MPKRKSCVMCGTTIATKRLKINGHSNVVTCSQPCSKKRLNIISHLNKRARRRLSVPDNYLAIRYESWLDIIKRFDGKCAYCRWGEAETMDHVVPLSRGGRHALPNILPCCGFCNQSKANMFLVEWRVRGSMTPIFDELLAELDL